MSKKPLFVLLGVGLGVVMRRLIDADWGYSLRRSRNEAFCVFWFDVRPKGRNKKGTTVSQIKITKLFNDEQRRAAHTAFVGLGRLVQFCKTVKDMDALRPLIEETLGRFSDDRAAQASMLGFVIDKLDDTDLQFLRDYGIDPQQFRQTGEPIMVFMTLVEIAATAEGDAKTRLIEKIADAIKASDADMARNTTRAHAAATLEGDHPLAFLPPSSTSSDSSDGTKKNQGEEPIDDSPNPDEAEVPPAPTTTTTDENPS